MAPLTNVPPVGQSDPNAVLRSEKIRPWHYERTALVYVRQSSPQQVLDHQESTRLQYGLRTRAHSLGWTDAQVLVIDDDLGKSGAHVEGRDGFQRLVSEVSLAHVGIILGIEMSRLARCSKDWHQLLELCALFGTLLADLDGIYDPGQYNDRLLLGLKGTLSEAELHMIKQRMYQGLLNKARRGDLHLPLPTGYVRRPSGEVILDPDEQVQHVIRLIFRKFEEVGTVHGVLRYLAQHQIQMGIRVRTRSGRGELEWRRPNRETLLSLLKHPIYAGAYVYGRRQIDPRRQRVGRPRTGRVSLDPAAWEVLLPDRYPAYISWTEYEAHVARLQENRSRTAARGAVRHGPTLLAGLLTCGRCGARMSVHYGGRQDRSVYQCTQQVTLYGGGACQHVVSRYLDDVVAEHVLAALQPAALDLSLAAAAHLEQERADLARHWAQRQERAAYEAERAGRQYRLVEPENRLVARQLERAWEEALTAQRQLQQEAEQALRAQPRGLSDEDRRAISRLAADLPAVWQAPTTTVADRKEIVRQVVEQVIVAARGRSEQVGMTIRWVGGAVTTVTVLRPVRSLADLSYYPQICAHVRTLHERGLSPAAIATQLPADGFMPPMRQGRFSTESIRDLVRTIEADQDDREQRGDQDNPAAEWSVSSLARELRMPASTVYTWIRQGRVRAWRQTSGPSPWIIGADATELSRLRDCRQRTAEPAGTAQPPTCARMGDGRDGIKEGVFASTMSPQHHTSDLLGCSMGGSSPRI